MLKLNQLFTDHMVVAAGKPIRVFGTGKGHICVKFCSNTAECISKEDSWLVELPAMEYGGPYEMEVTLDDEKIVLKDIYVGEVLLLAGQSNNQMKVMDSSKERHLAENNPLLRFFMLLRIEDEELVHPEDGWVTGDGLLDGWPLLGTFMALEIYKRKGIAVGLIGCYQGASNVESWLPEEICNLAQFNLPLDQKTPGHTPGHPYSAWNVNGRLYNFMFKKIVPYPISNVIWYQGESDSSVAEAKIYDKEVAALINRWRTDLLQPELPFIVVQIHNHRSDDGWKGIQAAQLRVPELVSNTKTVVSGDLCETDDIHPQSKHALALRIVDTLEY